MQPRDKAQLRAMRHPLPVFAAFDPEPGGTWRAWHFLTSTWRLSPQGCCVAVRQWREQLASTRAEPNLAGHNYVEGISSSLGSLSYQALLLNLLVLGCVGADKLA